LGAHGEQRQITYRGWAIRIKMQQALYLQKGIQSASEI
jgi:hypothetical protein